MKLDSAIARAAIAMLLALACLVVGGALLLGWLPIDRRLPPLGDAVSVEATITGSRVQPGEWSRGKFPRKSGDRYFLQVAFPVSPTQVQANEIEVSRAEFDANLPGGRVTVWYFPEQPQISTLGGSEDLADKGSRFGQLLGWVLLGVGVAGTAIYGNKLHVARGGQSVL
jgi:hypothetical protein